MPVREAVPKTKAGAGEMAQALRAFASLPEDLSLVSSSQMCVTPHIAPSPETPTLFSCLCRHPFCTWLHTRALTHACTPSLSHSLRCWEFWDQDTSRFVKGWLSQTVSLGHVLTWWRGPISSLDRFVSALIWFKRVEIS